MDKKAALNLGINTVVVMVIAMVVIGAGVSFIRTFFSAGTDSLIGAFEGVGDLGIQPDRNNPFVLSRENIEGRPGSQVILQAGIYNPTTINWNNVEFKKNPSCADESIISVDGVKQNIPAGQFRGFTIAITLPSGQGKTICSLELQDADGITSSKQITVDWGN